MSPSPHAPVSPGIQVAIVTGGSAGLGLEIARALVQNGYRVAIIGRQPARLESALASLLSQPITDQPNTDAQSPLAITCCADLLDPDAAEQVVEQVLKQWGRIDVVVNNIGQSDRGLVDSLDPNHLMQRIEANVVPTLNMSRAALPHLETTSGTIINIGSLAAKVGARFLGAYPASKHALAGLTQQMRLEWQSRGVHVGLLNPGPIRRDDAGNRYADQINQSAELPDQAKLPGGGTKVKGLDPARVAQAVLQMIRKRQPDRLLPAYLRPLVAIGHLCPPLGDWLLLRFTNTKKSTP